MKELRYALKHEWYILILLILPFIAIPFIWGHLPAQVPTHWDMHGNVNGTSSRLFAVLFNPALNIGIYLLFLYIHKIDPKKRLSFDQKPMPVIRLIIVLFMLCIHASIIYSGITHHTSNEWIYPAVALFFIVIGNYMRTIPHNYFIGIRVPWTLESEANWRQTHRMASWLWVAGGIILLILFPVLSDQIYSVFFIAVIIAISVIPMIFSFYIYKTKPKSKQ